ncbi:MAG: hypothetical protein NXI10_13790 [bacterium]|nr:hypothetical protein [bacterium]
MLPVIGALLMVRLIIINGLGIWFWIQSTVHETFHFILINWELDHAAFGFSLGLPMLVFTFFLLLIRYYSMVRMFLATLVFYVIQAIALLAIIYLSADIVPLPLSSFSYVYFQDMWFINAALIAATLVSYAILLTALLLLKISNRKSSPKTIDQ